LLRKATKGRKAEPSPNPSARSVTAKMNSIGVRQQPSVGQKEKGRLLWPGWIRSLLAARALTANLTAKRTDAGGIGDLGRTPKSPFS
jgi:hypothetical protein